LLQQTNAADSNVTTRSLAPFDTKRNNFNLNYKYSNNGEELNVDADYTNFISSLYNTVSNELSNFNKVKYATNASQNNADVLIKLAL
jgi:hypothetical protein